jgi:hypothetical protein
LDDVDVSSGSGRITLADGASLRVTVENDNDSNEQAESSTRRIVTGQAIVFSFDHPMVKTND